MANLVLHDGVLYPSQAAAARALRVGETTIYNALRDGRLEGVGRRRSGPVRVRDEAGNVFGSMAAAAAVHCLSRVRVQQLARAGRRFFKAEPDV